MYISTLTVQMQLVLAGQPSERIVEYFDYKQKCWELVYTYI